MREVLPATPAAEQADAALNLLQLNYTDNDHPFSVRSVLPYMRLVHDSPEALAEYVSPMTVSNKAAIWLQLKAEPDAQAAVHTTLPDAVDNRYYQTLFDHVKHGAEITPGDTWLQNPRPLATWEQLENTRGKHITEAYAKVVDTSLPIGPHGDHRSYDYDIMTAASWMVCRQKSATKHWPIATNPERTPDALHLGSYVKQSHSYTRLAISLSSAHARNNDEANWNYVFKTATQHFETVYGGHDENFRALAQTGIRHFAMQNRDYQKVIASEAEAYDLSSGRELSHISLAALCAVIEQVRKP